MSENIREAIIGGHIAQYIVEMLIEWRFLPLP